MFVLTPAIAVALFVYAGFNMLLGGANPRLYEKGKNIFTQTVLAVGVMLLAWLIVDTLLATLAPNRTGPWWQIECTSDQLIPGVDVPTGPGTGYTQATYSAPIPHFQDASQQCFPNEPACISGSTDGSQCVSCKNPCVSGTDCNAGPGGISPGTNDYPNGAICVSGNDCQSRFCNLNINPPVCQ